MGCVGSNQKPNQNRRNENNNNEPPRENRGNEGGNLAPPQQRNAGNSSIRKQGGSVSVMRHTNRFTEEQVQQKREAMKQSLEEGHSKPPTVNYPTLEPISAIQ